MTGRYKAYPEYKDSGKNYYGEVPNHWVLQKIKHNSYVKGRQGWQNLRADEYQDEGPILVTGSHFDKNGGVDWEKCYHVSEERYSRDKDICLQEGDVLLTKDGTIGKIAFIDQLPDKACLNSHLLIIRDLYQRYNQRYLYHLLNSDCFKGFIPTRQTGTTFMGITQESVEEFPLIICPLNEQQKIVNFLDHETAKIDTLIAKQEKLIELLKEKRQAVISHAVTRGLNPDDQMKDSGVEWLGEVPEHWIVKKLKFCANLLSQKEKITTQKVIALENIEGSTGKYITTNSKYSGDDVSFNEGDILFGKLRPYLSKVFLCDTSGISFGDILAFRPNNETSSSFLFYTMISEWFIEIVNSSTYGSKMPRASSDFINEMEIVIPPINEQIKIAEELDTILGKFEILTEKSTAAIGLMKERKTALISAAVTGKIDVRSWQTSEVETS